MREIFPRIVVDESVRSGHPVIQGTRVPVDILLGHLAAGMSAHEVADAYGVTIEDVHAALAYAAQVVADDIVRAAG